MLDPRRTHFYPRDLDRERWQAEIEEQAAAGDFDDDEEEGR